MNRQRTIEFLVKLQDLMREYDASFEPNASAADDTDLRSEIEIYLPDGNRRKLVANAEEISAGAIQRTIDDKPFPPINFLVE